MMKYCRLIASQRILPRRSSASILFVAQGLERFRLCCLPAMSYKPSFLRHTRRNMLPDFWSDPGSPRPARRDDS